MLRTGTCKLFESANKQLDTAQQVMAQGVLELAFANWRARYCATS